MRMRPTGGSGDLDHDDGSIREDLIGVQRADLYRFEGDPVVIGGCLPRKKTSF